MNVRLTTYQIQILKLALDRSLPEQMAADYTLDQLALCAEIIDAGLLKGKVVRDERNRACSIIYPEITLHGRTYLHNQSTPTDNADKMANDRHFMELAICEARRSEFEDDKVHPFVGAVAVKDGKLLGKAHRGEKRTGRHAEFTLLECMLKDEVLAGATIYATLEPCTTRNHPKVPCAKRLQEHKVARVVIGMLDPNPDICGKGQLLLREANIVTELFPSDLMAQIEELNRDFIRDQKQKAAQRAAAKAKHEGVGSPTKMVEDTLAQFHSRLKSREFCGMNIESGCLALAVIPEDAPVGNLEMSDLTASVGKLADTIGGVPSYSEFGGRYSRRMTIEVSRDVPPKGASEVTDDGCVRAASTYHLYVQDGNVSSVRNIHITAIEGAVINAIKRYLVLQGHTKRGGPCYVSMAMLNLQKCVFMPASTHFGGDRVVEGDVVPTIIRIENPGLVTDQKSVGGILRPAFDFIWREFGYSHGSVNFSKEGAWLNAEQQKS